jgi:hypothetical protein
MECVATFPWTGWQKSVEYAPWAASRRVLRIHLMLNTPTDLLVASHESETLCSC